MARYFGSVCTYHPDFFGERLSSDRICVGCKKQRKREARRRPENKGLTKARFRDQMPPWADKKAIAAIYRDRPAGMVVDHDIPLKGELVSGLHVETNLKYLTEQENHDKSNSFEVF